MPSKLFKIGTIYSRIGGLIRKGHIKEIDKPIWFDVYTHFPPKYEPTFDRPAPAIEVKDIFYEEDTLRAKLHKAYPKHLGVIDLESNSETNSQRWIKMCKEYMANGMAESEAVQKLGENLQSKEFSMENEKKIIINSLTY